MRTLGMYYANPAALRASFRVVDLDGNPKTGLVAGDFAITVRWQPLAGAPGVYSTTVTVTEEHASNLPGWYTFAFTPADRGRFYLEATPSFVGAARGVLSAAFDNRGGRPEAPAVYVLLEDAGILVDGVKVPLLLPVFTTLE